MKTKLPPSQRAEWKLSSGVEPDRTVLTTGTLAHVCSKLLTDQTATLVEVKGKEHPARWYWVESGTGERLVHVQIIKVEQAFRVLSAIGDQSRLVAVSQTVHDALIAAGGQAVGSPPSQGAHVKFE